MQGAGSPTGRRAAAKGAHCYGFAVTRARPAPAGLHAETTPIAAGWQVELAGPAPERPDALARGLFGLKSGDRMLTHDDPACGVFRAMALAGDELIGALLVDRCPLRIRRDWLAARLGTPLDAAERFRLLDGRPDGAMRPRGRTVCFCRDVGLNEVLDAVATGATSVRAIGEATTAGTNCGCCRAELARIVTEAGGEAGPVRRSRPTGT